MVLSAGGDGAEVIYALRNNDVLAKSILDNIEQSGQNIRKYYQRKLPSDLTKDYYFIIRDTSPAESVLVEYAFVDSTKDDQSQIKNDYTKLAEAAVKAISLYKGYPYAAPGENLVNDTYTVQRGDSLWSIAKRFNVSVDKLKQTNNLSSNLISIGQALTIPGVAPADQTNTTYIVQKGDSLWAIANANNTTVDEIVNLNDLINNTIYTGQVLKIPNSGSSSNKSTGITTTYTVQKGDTLYSLASKYNTTINAIKEANNLSSEVLSIGQSLIIPPESESTGQNYIPDSNTHTVLKGESLYSIANAYGITVNELKNANNLSSDILSIGQVLTIPEVSNTSRNRSNLYMVQKGDSLWSIASNYNVSINDIRKINNLSSDLLLIGQTLIIP